MPIPAKCKCPDCGKEHDYSPKEFFEPHYTRDVDLDKPPSTRDDVGTAPPVKDGIVEAVHKYYGQWPSPRLLGLARAIEAKFKDQSLALENWGEHQVQTRDDLLAEIGKVRKLFRNHEDRLTAIETLAPVLDQQILDLDADTTNLERQVESLKEKIKCLTVVDLLRKDATQPSSQPRTVEAPDEKGVMHDLIPGRSVVTRDWLNEPPEPAVYMRNEGKYRFLCWITPGKACCGDICGQEGPITWLFDLPGGDK